MRKLVTSIINIVLLLVTSLVLVLSLFAWYVSNREVSANGIEGRVKDPDNIVDTVTIYSFKKVNGTSDSTHYVVDNVVSTANPGQQAQMTYAKGLTTSNAISLKLMVIDFVGPVHLTNFIADTQVQKFIGYDNQAHPGWITESTGLSLSSVIKYSHKIDGITIPNNATTDSIITFSSDPTVDITSTNPLARNYKNFTYDNELGGTGNIINKYVQFFDSPIMGINAEEGISKLYILLDFYDDAFDSIFNNQIGNSVMDDATEITFAVDFRFIVIGRLVGGN